MLSSRFFLILLLNGIKYISNTNVNTIICLYFVTLLQLDYNFFQHSNSTFIAKFIIPVHLSYQFKLESVTLLPCYVYIGSISFSKYKATVTYLDILLESLKS